MEILTHRGQGASLTNMSLAAASERGCVLYFLNAIVTLCASEDYRDSKGGEYHGAGCYEAAGQAPKLEGKAGK